MKQPTWKEFLSDQRSVMLIVVTLATLFVTLYSYSKFLNHVELRAGVTFTDPLHPLVGPIDMTWPSFIALWGAILLAIVSMMRMPTILFKAMRAYTMLVGLRIICMWLMPLDPPTTMIPLVDPLAQLVTSGTAMPLTRDLFFSGHTSLLCLFGFVVPQKPLKVLFFSLAVFVGVAVILQHVHYSVDVVVAPLAAWTAVSLSGAADRA